MKKIEWYIQRIDHESGEITYEAHSITEGCQPEEESFIKFTGPNAKRDAETFQRGLAVPATN